MNTQSFNTENTNEASEAGNASDDSGTNDAGQLRNNPLFAGSPRRPLLARKMRLVSRLMRLEMRNLLATHPQPTRGDFKAAIRSLEERISGAVSPEELTTTLETLDKIAEEFGGRDALPLRSRGFGRRGGGSRGHRGHGRRDHRGHSGHHSYPELDNNRGHGDFRGYDHGHRGHNHHCGC